MARIRDMIASVVGMHYRVRLAVAMLVVMLGGLSVSAQQALTLRVHPDSSVEGPVVRLADIAELSGDTAAVKRAGNISLGFSPLVGSSREIRRDSIRSAMLAASFSENQFSFTAAEISIVRRAGQEVSSERVQELVRSEIASRISTTVVRWEVTRFDLTGSLMVPKGEIDIRADFASVRNLFQKFTVPVKLSVDGKLFRIVTATLELRAFGTVVVASRDIAMNDKLVPADLEKKEIYLSRATTDYIWNDARLRGAMATKNIKKGDPISGDSIAAAVVVKVGDTVRIEAHSGNIKIAITGEARSAGRIGDRIAVKNLESGKVLQAIVVDEGLVRINL